MKKLMELKKRKKNNKGFSLVELIIVIAIMAVLVAVLAPQFLKYVERSRNSTDAQNATAIATALQTWYADPSATMPADKATGTVTVNEKDAPTITDGSSNFISDALANAGLSKVTCKSKTAWTSYTVTYTITNGSIVITYGDTKFSNYMASGSTSTSASK